MNTLSNETLDMLFREARTYNSWLDEPVADDSIRQLYEVLKWGPTSTNSCPARFIFLRSLSPRKDCDQRFRQATCRKP